MGEVKQFRNLSYHLNPKHCCKDLEFLRIFLVNSQERHLPLALLAIPVVDVASC